MTSLIQLPERTAATPQAPAFVGGLDAAQLLRAEADLADRMNVLTGQREVLRTAMQNAEPVARVQYATQLTDLNLRMTEVQVELARVRSEMAAKGITAQPEIPPQFTAPPQLPPSHFLDNDQVTGIIIVFILAVLMPISIGFLRRMWKGSSKPATQAVTDAVSPRLDRLEHATDAIALEIERISEGQRFVTKVLAERPVSAPPPSSAQGQASVRGDATAMGEGKSFLALGAGPIEPIRMPERQGVRQSITPH